MIALTLSWSGAAVAQDYQKGVDAYQTGDYLTALREFRELAEQGDARAQTLLGVMYRDGQGVAQDYAEAVKWSRLAAEQGNATAQYNLGVIYGKGQGVAQDYVTAHMWYNIAAASGNEGAGGLRDFLAKQMTSEDVSKAQKLAREWMENNPRQ